MWGVCVWCVCVCEGGGVCAKLEYSFRAKESVLSKNHKLYMTYYIVLSMRVVITRLTF